MAWLDDHPPARSQFRRPRRERVSGVIVVHTAENPADLTDPDTGAEGVANFIRTRDTPGSYHDLCDSDSTVNLVGYDAEAFQDGTGSNPHALSVSAAVRTVDWAGMPTARRNRIIANMAAAAARQAAYVKAQTGVVVPARQITREQSEARQPGFISHAKRDPARRSDPGADFPWAQFLNTYANLMEGDMPLTEDDKTIIKQAVAEQLDSEARRVTGITSYDQYLQNVLDAARAAATPSEVQAALRGVTDEFAAAVVAALPEGSVEVAQIEQAMHRVLASTVGRLEFTDAAAEG